MKVKTQEKIAIFPGTFDPPTLGHLDVIERGRHLFDRLIVAIGVNADKTELFPLALRKQLLEELTRDWPNITVEAYTGLTVDLVRKRSAVAILRGLRNMTDLEYEFQLALTNRAIAAVDTVDERLFTQAVLNNIGNAGNVKMIFGRESLKLR